MKKLTIGLTVLSALIAAPSQAQTPGQSQLRAMVKNHTTWHTTILIDYKCHQISKPAFEILSTNKKNLEKLIINIDPSLEKKMFELRPSMNAFVDEHTCAELTSEPFFKENKEQAELVARSILLAWEGLYKNITIGNKEDFKLGFQLLRIHTYDYSDFWCDGVEPEEIGQVIKFHKSRLDSIKARPGAPQIMQQVKGLETQIVYRCLKYGEMQNIDELSFKIYGVYKREWEANKDKQAKGAKK
ncbi:MAG: hypothetical protein COA91_09270 [Robiginitomaculum sp.]|nr:MAG: hypothetical protein COA91_09270 [Robiginitomaculum sp.]